MKKDGSFKHINAESIGTIMALNTDNVPAKDNSKALEAARELAIKLNYIHEAGLVTGGNGNA